MKQILITGANGQLGSELKILANSQKKLKFIFTDVQDLDILNLEQLKNFFEKNEISAIVNCAAYTAVDKAEDEPQKAYQINAIGVKNLVSFAKNLNIPFIHISTDYVFDGKNYKPYKENDAVNPISVYGKTKAEGEKFALEYANSLIIRTSWLYSSYGHNFVKTVLRLSEKNNVLKIVSDQLGTPTYAYDLALAILQILQKYFFEDFFKPEIYHFSNLGVASWYDFAYEIVRILNLKVKVLPIETKDFPTKAQRPHFSLLDKTKIIETYQISIPHWRESLEKMLKILI